MEVTLQQRILHRHKVHTAVQAKVSQLWEGHQTSEFFLRYCKPNFAKEPLQFALVDLPVVVFVATIPNWLQRGGTGRQLVTQLAKHALRFHGCGCGCDTPTSIA